MAKLILSAEYFQNEHAVFTFLEVRIWPDGPVCLKCAVGGDRIRRLAGKTTRIGLHKCYACMMPCTVKMGTVFESSLVPAHIWLQTVHLMCSSKEGISTNQIHRTMGVTLKTASFMTMGVREALRTIGVEPRGGAGITVEADETFIGGESRNRAYGPSAP